MKEPGLCSAMHASLFRENLLLFESFRKEENARAFWWPSYHLQLDPEISMPNVPSEFQVPILVIKNESLTSEGLGLRMSSFSMS